MTSGNNAPGEGANPGARLSADRNEIGGFVRTLFRHADEGSFVSLRSFLHDRSKPPLEIRAVQINGEGLEPVIAQATGAANRAARHRERAVFAPPVCTLSNGRRAGEADLRNGLALAIECDERPERARQRLEGILGPATIIVASGGEWADPETGAPQAKLHLYWRLAEPTREPTDHARLKRARAIATALVGGDPSAVPLVHPLRWPGSWHRKGEAKLCRIGECREEGEIDLDDALERLEQAAALALEHVEGPDRQRLQAALASGRKTKSKVTGGPGDPEAHDPDFDALAAAIPNEDEPWAEWVAVGLAFYAASGGAAAGFNAWDRWSRKSTKHDGGTTAQWEHFHTSPPDRTGTGALVNRARRHDPGFRLPSWGEKREPGGREEAAGEEPGAAAGKSQARHKQHRDGRRLIYLNEERVNPNARACAELLAEDVFLRGHLPAVLVRVEEVGKTAEDPEPDREPEPGVIVGGVRHAHGSLILTEPIQARLQYRLDERALFKRYDLKQGQWVSKSCPATLAQRLIGAAAELGFRPCAGIVTVPLFLAGRIVTANGYYRPRGCYLDTPAGIPPIPKAPTREDAQKALATLLRPFEGYFEGKEGEALTRARCAFSAAALTAVLRPSLSAAPAILVDGNVPGSGKGKAARALATLATGRLPATITEGHAEEETEKRLAAAILSGASAILLDNLQRTLASSTLESGLTEGHATIRPFGKLTDVTVPCNALVLITANNAGLRADMLRRTLPVRIVADTETPELREFGFDPYERAREERPGIIAAGLTIARAWWLARDTEAGRGIRPTLGSFEEWAALVAGAVRWLVGMDPVELIEERKKQDPRRGEEQAVIEALAAWQGKLRDESGNPRTWWQAKEAATGIPLDLWAAVIQTRGDAPSSRQVGRWLTARKDKVFRGHQLSCNPDRDGIMEWTLRGLRGFAGFSSSSRASFGDGQESPADDGDAKNKGPGDQKPRQTPQTPQADEPSHGWSAEL
jgi:hypothetical protein